MEISDDFQDMGNPGGGVSVANMAIPNHRHTPDSPMVSATYILFIHGDYSSFLSRVLYTAVVLSFFLL